MVYDEIVQAPLEGLTLLPNATATTTRDAPHAERKSMVHTLALEVLILDPDVQPRATMSRSTIRDYAVLYAEGQMLAPIDVYHEGGHYRVADGFHRVQAARQAGRTEITATVQPGTKREALLHACRANKHGKPLTNEDKRRVVTRMLEDAEWGQWSDNTIAKHCGVAQSFVSKTRRSLHSEISEPRTYTTRHGTVATMDTRAIGKRAASPAEARAADAEVPALLGSTDADKAVRPEAGAHAIPVTHGETEGIVHPASPPAASQEQLELLRERPPTSVHIVAPAHGGALAAPPRAQPWVLAIRDTLARLLEAARTSLQRLQEYLDTLQETQGYRQLTAEDEQPFASLHAFVTAPPPYGLGCDWSGWAAVVAALHTVLGDQSPAPDAAPLPERSCPTPPAGVSYRQRILAVLPTLPASFTTQHVAERTGLTPEAVRKVLPRLVTNREVRRVKPGRYRKPHRRPRSARTERQKANAQRHVETAEPATPSR